MSKKKKKPSAKKPVKKTVPKKKPARSAARRAPVRTLAAAAAGRTSQATIFLYTVDGGIRVRTSPHLMTAGPGHIEWTVVNLASDDAIAVEITFPKEGPWGGQPILIKDGWIRLSLDGAAEGRFRYNVTANGFTEDPEIEIPEN